MTKSEPQTIVNAVRTWGELVSFMRARDRTTIERLDLASFLTSGSRGPKRALNSLRWLSKLGHLGWQLDSIVLDPPASRRAAARSQALVVEPPMLTHLERGIKEAFRPSGPSLDRLAGQLVGGRRGTTLSPHSEGPDGEAVPLYAVLSLPQREAGEQTRWLRLLHPLAVH